MERYSLPINKLYPNYKKRELKRMYNTADPRVVVDIQPSKYLTGHQSKKR